MKKRGQMLLLVILIISFVILLAIMFSFMSGKITGDVINLQLNNSQQQSNQNIKCLISSPFYCKVWSIDKENSELKIQFANSVNKNLIIQEIILTDCEYLETNNIYLDRKTGRTAKFRCSSPLQLSGSQITVRYKDESGGLQLLAFGNFSH